MYHCYLHNWSSTYTNCPSCPMPVYSSTGSTEPLRATGLFNKDKLIEWLVVELKQREMLMKQEFISGEHYYTSSLMVLRLLLLEVKSGKFDE